MSARSDSQKRKFQPSPSVIIGHTTAHEAKIWVRGDRWYPSVDVRVVPSRPPADDASESRARQAEPEATEKPKRLRLRLCDDFTGVLDFGELAPQTTYTVRAKFRRPWWWVIAAWLPKLEASPGRFRTAPEINDRTVEEQPFEFLVGSCNLSNVKINNLLGLVGGMAGVLVAQRSLERRSNDVVMETFLLRWCKAAIVGITKLCMGLVYMVTRYRQPAPPLVISPFVRLSALVGTQTVLFTDGTYKPSPGTIVFGADSGASGVVVFEPTVNDERRWKASNPDTVRGARGRVVIFRLNDTPFLPRQERLVIATGESIGRIHTVADDSGRAPPAFMLHVGDQIYFDFPEPDKPTVGRYRYAYREAWVEDVIARHFLAQLPQYMTLDDHEIFNNYARDAAPYEGHEASEYELAALRAYREYVHVRHPLFGVDPGWKPCSCGKSFSPDDALFYSFQHCSAHFFVLDTRSERDDGKGQIVSCCQLHYLKEWLKQHRHDLAFVVSSVPFVPEVYATADEERIRQNRAGEAIKNSDSPNGNRDGRGITDAASRGGNQTAEGINDESSRSGNRVAPNDRSVDKWSAPVFAAQRESIIRHIYDLKMERVVFLTGDMHCCYYATMRVGPTDHAVTIHELGAGPINQMRYGQPSDFFERYRGKLGSDRSAIDYLSRIEQFYGRANAIMQIAVGKPEQLGSASNGVALAQTLSWNVLHTVAEPVLRPGAKRPRADDPVMWGDIHFAYGR